MHARSRRRSFYESGRYAAGWTAILAAAAIALAGRPAAAQEEVLITDEQPGLIQAIGDARGWGSQNGQLWQGSVDALMLWQGNIASVPVF